MQGLTIPFTGLKRQYHNLRAEILDATDEVLRSGQLMDGNHTAEFEHWLAKKNKVKYAITTHSGTLALEIIASYCALQHTAGPPRVLIPSLTFAATANAFVRTGWDVQFVDTDNRGIISFAKIPNITDYQAVVLVGLYGASIAHYVDPAAGRKIKAWSLNNVTIIEDAAQHWLAADCTRLGIGSAISFDPMKNLPCYGNGGAVLTNSRELYEYAINWTRHGKPSNHSAPASNARMSELDCAHLRVKSKYVDAWQQRRRTIAKFWIEQLQKNNIQCLIDNDSLRDHAVHKFVITLDQRDQIKEQLAMRKIETKVHYERPLHEIGYFRQYSGPDLLATCSALSRRVLSLPCYPELSDLEVEFIVDQVIDCVSTTHN